MACLSDVDDLLTSGTQLEKLLVVHPAIVPVEAHILYVAYEGWIYSGRYQWSIDKLILTDSYGGKKSFCKDKGKLLPSGLPIKFTLGSGDCKGTTLGKPEYPILPFTKVTVCVIRPQRSLLHDLIKQSIPFFPRSTPSYRRSSTLTCYHLSRRL